MRNVKWVTQLQLQDQPLGPYDGIPRKNITPMIPVIPLSDLAEVVEGLKMIATGKWDDATTIALGGAILSGLEQHGRVSANEWLAKRLLARLAPEAPKGDGDESH